MTNPRKCLVRCLERPLIIEQPGYGRQWIRVFDICDRTIDKSDEIIMQGVLPVQQALIEPDVLLNLLDTARQFGAEWWRPADGEFQ